MRFPKISIVTPSFNQGSFIEETIESVLGQNYPGLEYIIIDGGSNDESVEIIKKYQKHLKYWVSEKDAGQSNAINKGLSHCTGEVFNWLNSDDLLMPNALSQIGRAFGNDDIDLFSGQEIHFGTGKDTVKHGSIIFPELEMNLLSGIIYQPSTFWRMEALRELLPIREGLHYLMDTDLWVRYILTNGTQRIHKSSTPIAKFRLHAGSKSTLYQKEFMAERWLLRQEVFDCLKLEPKDWLNWVPDSKISGDSIGMNLIHDSVRSNYYKRIIADEIAYEHYLQGNYERLRSFLQSSMREGVITRKVLKYLLRMMIPTTLLKSLRG